MTQEQIDAIRSRCEKATPGPWYEEGFAELNEAGDYTELIDSCPADAAFIAHSRTDIPILLDEVEQLQNKVKLQKASCSLVKTVEAGKTLDENAMLRKALEIAAEECGTPIPGWDKQKIMDRWIKKAEEMK